MQISDSSIKLKESPFQDQGQHDTKDVIGHFNSATIDAMADTTVDQCRHNSIPTMYVMVDQ